MKRAGTLLIAAVLLLTLCACKRETRPAVGLGTFHGEQVSVYGGDWQPIGEVYSGQTYLTLTQAARAFSAWTVKPPRSNGKHQADGSR